MMDFIDLIGINRLTLFLLGFISTISLLFYFLPIYSGDKLTFYRRGEWGFLLKTDFFKVPLRWISLPCLMFLSLFREREKIYINEALRTEFSYFNFSEEFSTTIGKEPNYYYAQFIGNMVNYFQEIRYKSQLRKDKDNTYLQGVSGLLSIHSNAFKLASHRFERFQQIRYDYDGWIPKEDMKKYEDKDLERYFHYQKSLEIQKEEELKVKLNELNYSSNTIVRDVSKKPTKRFDSNIEKGIE